MDIPVFVVDLITISGRINNVQPEPYTVFVDHYTHNVQHEFKELKKDLHTMRRCLNFCCLTDRFIRVQTTF